MQKLRPIFFPVALLLVLGVRLLGLDKGVWLDEIETIRLAKSFDGNGFSWLLQYHGYPPLYPILLSFWMYLGQSEPVLRSLSVVISIATFWASWRLATRYSTTCAFFIAAFFCSFPLLLRYSVEIRDLSGFFFSEW